MASANNAKKGANVRMMPAMHWQRQMRISEFS